MLQFYIQICIEFVGKVGGMVVFVRGCEDHQVTLEVVITQLKC